MANLAIGTPPQVVEVQLDTGSAVIHFPCAGDNCQGSGCQVGSRGSTTAWCRVRDASSCRHAPWGRGLATARSTPATEVQGPCGHRWHLAVLCMQLSMIRRFGAPDAGAVAALGTRPGRRGVPPSCHFITRPRPP